MSKRPASLTSDLLARKGEAEPSPIDPAARMTLAAGMGGAGTGATGPEFSSSGDDNDEVLELRPRPPEPEVIYSAEDEDERPRPLRLVAGIIAAVVVVGGIVMAVTSKTEQGVAPVSSQIVAEAPANSAPATTAPASEAPAASLPAETETSSAPDTIVPAAPAQQQAGGTPELRPATDSGTATQVPSAPAAEEQDGPAASPYSTYAEKRTAVPVEDKPAPAKAEKITATPKAASGGSYVIQLLALRDEASARKAYAGLQKKYAALSGHGVDIEKADLGAKGTYYRVRAAGFESKAAAAQACTKVKSAGQDCMVKKR